MKDTECSKPSLLPGDIVRSKKTGNILVITGSHVVVNGGKYNWNEDIPSKIEHGWTPEYSAEMMSGLSGDKTAWFELDELEVVELGLCHKYNNNNIQENCRNRENETK